MAEGLKKKGVHVWDGDCIKESCGEGFKCVPSEGSSPGKASRAAVTALYRTAPLL